MKHEPTRIERGDLYAFGAGFLALGAATPATLTTPALQSILWVIGAAFLIIPSLIGVQQSYRALGRGST